MRILNIKNNLVPSVQVRESNMEILRLIATFLIICIHSNFLSLGWPKVEDFICNPTATWLRTFLNL